MDDDDFNSELLGGLQRQRNLQQNEATRQAIEGLREDLKRKERAEAAAPKCPYCAGAISNGVAKCRHCSSDIQWCEVQGKAYALKAEDNAQYFVLEKQRVLEEKGRREKERIAANTTNCKSCGTGIMLATASKNSGRCAPCATKRNSYTLVFGFVIVVLICCLIMLVS